MSDDVTIDLLKSIRDKIDTTNAELHETNVRVDRLHAHVVESELRTATLLVEVNGTMRDVRNLIRDRFDLRDRVESCEREIAELKQRLPPAR